MLLYEKNMIDPDEIDQIKDLVFEATYSSTKADASAALNQLNAIFMHHESSLEPYAREKFKELISYAKTASGRVTEKEHWINVVNSAFGKFKSAAS